MKKTILTLSIVLFSLAAFCQTNNYFDVMLTVKEQYEQADSIEAFVEVANKLERIAKAEKDKWLPYYYAAFSYINMSFIETDNILKDKYLDKAQELISSALEINPKESELYILHVLLYSGRLVIDPMGRGQEFAPKLGEAYAKATELNPENPRIYYMQGNQIYNTPENFGGGVKKSLPLFQKAKEKYDKFVPESKIHPDWGKDENLKLLENCTK